MSIATNIIHFIRGASTPETALMKKIEKQLEFRQSTPLTIGVECEFGILTSLFQPAHVALDIVGAVQSPNVQYELYQHMIEITTGVCSGIKDVERDLTERLESLFRRMPEHNTSLIGTGSLPLLRLEQTVPVETERYQLLRQRRQALYERFTTLGMHVHIGMADTSSCIRFHNYYMHFLPHLLALSANSPFEEGRDTGFASIRPTITESMPIGGLPYQFKTWQDYKNLCLAMAHADSISDLKDLWWDLRPCPRYGTLEIRICDQPATLAEVTAIAAFVHCLGHWFSAHQNWLDEMPRPNNWRMRENKWRVMRYGLDATIVVNDAGDTKPLKDDIGDWLERLQPFYEKLGYEGHLSMLKQIIEKGNGAQRQRRVFEAKGNLEAVCAHAIAELKNGEPMWDAVSEMEPVRSGPLAEAFAACPPFSGLW
jgi:glutamate---cysteine ligase / carboxylate-amine ligase